MLQQFTWNDKGMKKVFQINGFVINIMLSQCNQAVAMLFSHTFMLN